MAADVIGPRWLASSTVRRRGGATIYQTSDFERAERFLPWRMVGTIPGWASIPRWLDDSRCWYRVSTGAGWRFMVVDATTGERQEAFDHDRVAACLQGAGVAASADQLDLNDLRWIDDQSIEFDYADQRWRCQLSDYDCLILDDRERNGVRSPDGSLLAYVDDHDLWLRDLSSGTELQLTHDGTAEAPYGLPIPSPLAEVGLPLAGQPGRRAAVLWSPDGRRLLTHRMQTAGATRLTMVQSAPLDGSIRPRAISYVYPLPGDQNVPHAELMIIDVQTGEQTWVDIGAWEQLYYGSPIPASDDRQSGTTMWWRSDSQRCYFLRRFRGNRRLALYEVDARTGSARVVVDEHDDAPVDANLTVSGPPNVRVLERSDEVIWYSHRDGWGHLYLYDLRSGQLIRQLTRGEWAVADLCQVDEDRRQVYLTSSGWQPEEDLYTRRLLRISLDGGEPELLTEADGSHQISFAPGGRWFTTTWSRMDSPPTLQLCRNDGSVVAGLEVADFSALQESGWQFPERFARVGRDGTTPVYGVLIKPSNFDPEHRYPIIDAIYAGPQTNQAPTALAELNEQHGLWQAQAIAELGFIVVMIDGLGMPHRSRDYRDVSYRNLADAGLPDHIRVLTDLATERSYLDLDRVGIYGHSAGGYASCQAILAHPEFYSVCVSSAGNHDHRLDKAWWIERYQGYPVDDHYRAQANRTIADQLNGKLLLIHGEVDENVTLAATTSLVDAFVVAGKKVDLMIVPNRPHACGADPQVISARWDYFVRHLAGVEPPGYLLQKSAGQSDPV